MIKIEQAKMPIDIEDEQDFYVLTKVSDDVFNGVHPNGIDKGYTATGSFNRPPIVGESFHISNGFRYLTTSVVTEIVDDTTFKTMNSTYKLTKWEQSEEE